MVPKSRCRGPIERTFRGVTKSTEKEITELLKKLSAQ
jgi:hypothetical protein